MIPDLSLKKINLFKFGVVGIFLFFAFGLGLAQYISVKEKNIGDKIYPNVYVDNIQMGGKTKEEVKTILSAKQKKLDRVKITVLYKEEPIATMSGQKLALKTNIADIADRAYLIGRVDYLPSRTYQKITSIFNLEKFDFKTTVVYNDSVVKEFIGQTEDRYNKPAKNALFKFENGRVTAFKPEEKGVKIETDKFKENFRNTITDLKKKVEDKKIAITDQISEPEITLAEANEFGIEELIGEGVSNYAGSIPERVHNLILAASRINGVLVPVGEEFSFNAAVGEITGLTGYKQAYIIRGGKTVLDDGGGVCQASTTLFRAALNTGLPITARTAHAYRVGYYENDSKPGFDATIFIPTVDFKFKNDTSAAILIQTEVDQANAILRFKFYGKKDGRKVEISDSRVWDAVPPLPDVRQDDPTLPKGTVKQVDFPAWGAKAAFDYKVTREGEILQQRTFSSVYRPWQAVYLVGTGEF